MLWGQIYAIRFQIQIHWHQVLKQLLKGITAVRKSGIPLNGLWDVIFKQPLLLPLSGTERWAGCLMGVMRCAHSPCSCCFQLLSGSGCRCKCGLLHSSQADVPLHGLNPHQFQAEKGKNNISVSYHFLPNCCPKLFPLTAVSITVCVGIFCPGFVKLI